MLIVGIAAMVVAPLAAVGVQAAVSRQREYLADATGALTTRYPEGLARALEKLGAYGRPMQQQNSSMSHLWISDPMRPGAMARFFSTHPPLADRIARLPFERAAPSSRQARPSRSGVGGARPGRLSRATRRMRARAPDRRGP